MGTINISTEPHELVINGTTIRMQADPTAGKEWETLLEVEWGWSTPEIREQSLIDLVDGLCGVAETPQDAELIRGLNVGVPTLSKAVEAYVAMVTGFPTKPHSGSTRSSKKT